MSTYRGKFEKGKVIFTGDVPPLKDGDPVVVVTEGTQPTVNGPADPADPFDTIGDDAVDTGITDMSVEHDHYIYGTPKRNQRKES
jgi:hypothetical protein